MESDLTRQVERADALADRLGTRGELVLDALASAGLRLDRYAAGERQHRRWSADELGRVAAIVDLLPELDAGALLDELGRLDLVLAPLRDGEPNVASQAWFGLIDAELGIGPDDAS